MAVWPSTMAIVLLQNIAIPEDSLDGWWSCNTLGDYGSALYDTSGNAAHGVISGTTASASGKSGKCASFDGTNDILTLPNLQSDSMTLCCWIKVAADNEIAMKYGSAGERSWILKVASNVLVFSISEAGTTVEDFTGTVVVNDNAWHFVCVQFLAANYVKIYIDGVLDNTTTTAITAIHASTAAVIFGKGPTDYYAGLIDEIRLYSRILTAEEILWLYTNITTLEALTETCNRDGYTEVPQNGVIRSETDIGPGKRRQRFTSLATYFSLTYDLTRHQRLVMDDFYRRGTRGGSVAFTWQHPDGYSVSARFASPPSYTPRNQGVTASVQLEVLP